MKIVKFKTQFYFNVYIKNDVTIHLNKTNIVCYQRLYSCYIN